ncbi:MAG: DUF3833 family protein [Rhodobacter sp.]|uniref:DUF3833 family protein n=1 Tax=Pararhodobacter sp. TaxID=2127056 RepID=UPI002C38AEEF|nr:DUF3833 family protein [Pararhodobacter sp.]MCC0073125.1 DUF3833 family protein [Rhodobacter sp.]HPD91122.1 DUF3833 family protein [Pararhodobacter sp.]
MLIATTLVLAVLLALIALRAWLFSFAAQAPADFRETGPLFDPRTALNGKIASEGVIFGPTGKAISRFVMQMEGRWAGRRGSLTESFRYDSGRVQERRWDLTLNADGSLEATAPDILGTGRGTLSGATLRLTYRIRLPEDAGGHVLDVIDWLYLMPNGTVMNRSQMRRFGVTVAELVATMRPVPAPIPEVPAGRQRQPDHQSETASGDSMVGT